MNITEKAEKILKYPICDHCLGRQFGQLLHGYTNAERGRLIRTIAAMTIDNEKEKSSMNMSNFSDFAFHNLEIDENNRIKKQECSICGNIFDDIEKYADKIIKKTKKLEFSTFLVGTKLSHELIEKEENLWESAGIDFCEPLKAEINREIGKMLEKKTKKKFNAKVPDVNFIVNVDSKTVSIEINPIFIYGKYQKLVRGIPQTRWPSKKYKTSVEQIVAKPFMKATKGKGHKFHGLGREDIDARCLAWRPFVLEIIEPKKRDIDIKKLATKIEKKVRIKDVKFSSIQEVREIKASRSDKTYRAIVQCDKKIEKRGLKKLKSLAVEIMQKTPRRVLHRRADRMRKRRVKSIKTRFINAKTFELFVRGEAGLYIKELISGDEGRTKPNISEILGCSCKCKELDVIKIG